MQQIYDFSFMWSLWKKQIDIHKHYHSFISDCLVGILMEWIMLFGYSLVIFWESETPKFNRKYCSR